MTKSSIRIVLADDHTIVRQGLLALLGSQPGMEVVGEAENGYEAVEKVTALSPDIVVMDLGMPGLNGIDAINTIREQAPKTNILVLSMHDGEEYIRPVLRAGVQGYLLKGADLSDLIKAIRTIIEGETFFSPVVTSLLQQDEQATPDELSNTQLTKREREVLQLIAEGFTTPQIAQSLTISVRTVDVHRRNISKKLNIYGVAGFVKYAIRIGLISPDL